jgi:hypothetical protein
MDRLADLTLYDRHHRMLGLVEVHSKLRTSAAWAAQYRGNLLSYGLPEDVPYFLIVTPDRIYFWNGRERSKSADPDLVLDAEPLFRPYFQRMQTSPGEIYPEAFELLVASWLREVVRDLSDDVLPVDLAATGLPAAIRGGHIALEDAA